MNDGSENCKSSLVFELQIRGLLQVAGCRLQTIGLQARGGGGALEGSAAKAFKP